MACWLWKNRNCYVFEHNLLSPLELIQCMEKWLNEFLEANDKLEAWWQMIEWRIQAEFVGLQYNMLCGLFKNSIIGLYFIRVACVSEETA